MNPQELLILSFFDECVGKEFKDKDISIEMIQIGIGTNDSSPHPYYNIVHKLRNDGLLIPYNDPLRAKGIVHSIDSNKYVLSKKALLLLQRDTLEKKYLSYVTELDFNKLKAESELATSKLADYSKTKKQSVLALIISIISAIAAILALIKK